MRSRSRAKRAQTLPGSRRRSDARDRLGSLRIRPGVRDRCRRKRGPRAGSPPQSGSVSKPFLDPLVGVGKPLFESQDLLADDLEPEVAGLDDPRMHRPDRDFVHAVAADAHRTDSPPSPGSHFGDTPRSRVATGTCRSATRPARARAAGHPRRTECRGGRKSHAAYGWRPGRSATDPDSVRRRQGACAPAASTRRRPPEELSGRSRARGRARRFPTSRRAARPAPRRVGKR